MPPDFDLSLPEGATPRYGESTTTRATVLYTTDELPDDVATALRAQLEERDWQVVDRDGSRRVIEARSGSAMEASAVIERGAAAITRVHISRRLERGHAFHPPEEPTDERWVTRPPLPAAPGETAEACPAAMRAACEALESTGGPDGLDCAMDHRSACVRLDDAHYLARATEDARARLHDALRAHALAGSRGARAQTLAQLRVELLFAKLNDARAGAADAASIELAELIERAEAEGVSVQPDAESLALFFAAPTSEIPATRSP